MAAAGTFLWNGRTFSIDKETGAELLKAAQAPKIVSVSRITNDGANKPRRQPNTENREFVIKILPADLKANASAFPSRLGAPETKLTYTDYQGDTTTIMVECADMTQPIASKIHRDDLQEFISVKFLVTKGLEG